jgi:DNA end-binding protein Ku
MTVGSSEQPPLGRPVWADSVTFGLVSVPVKLYPATVSHHGPELHMRHRDDLSPIRLRRYCELEDRELRQDEIARGADVAGGTVMLTEEDLEQLPLPSKHAVDVLAFIAETDVPAVAWSTPYLVGLGDRAPSKPYLLIAKTMRDAGLVAVTKVTLSTRESLAVLRERDGLLLLQVIRWPDEIRSPAGIRIPGAGEEEVPPEEIQVAQKLMASMSEGYDLDAERDTYTEALDQLLRAKAENREPPREETPTPGVVPPMDLMATLRDSIEKSRAQREAAAAPEKKAPVKKATAKKTTAKKTATKRRAA